MLDVAHMATHVGQMTGVSETKAMFKAVTENSAKVMHLKDYGIAKGNFADLVILQAQDPIEAIRLRPARLFVIRRGKVISTTAPVEAQLNLNGEKETVNFLR